MITASKPKIEIDFTDDKLTSTAGLVFVSALSKRLGLAEGIAKNVRVKKRQRGCSDHQMLMSLIYSFCSGNGHLSDIDALSCDTPVCRVVGIDRLPNSRRLGEYLATFTQMGLLGLLQVSRDVSRQVIPQVIDDHVSRLSYVPVFMDGSALEVSGRLFEGAKKGYNGEYQYWLHSVFVGGVWVSGRLNEGGVGVTLGWQEQLEKDVAPLLDSDVPVWLAMDNAYYNKEVIHYCLDQGWDYSVSLTDRCKRRPVLEQVDGLPDQAWQDIGMDESAIFAYHQPHGWRTRQAYVVIRRLYEGRQKRLQPAYTVILVSTDELPIEELVKRHRAKQGQENAFKGPLIELDLHHPPCRKFIANQAFYLCGQIAQVMLKAVQYQCLPITARKHGIRPIIRYLIRSVAKLTRSGRRWTLRFCKNAFKLDWLIYASYQLE